jgi:hypothetical protein
MIDGARAVAALGRAAGGVAEVFRPNATEAMRLAYEARGAALGQLGAEFRHAPGGWFDRGVDGLNRLPRPLLAFGTLGLFAYAMIDPDAFAQRMVGLAYVPEPLWWLLGAVVGFYFGARELHHARGSAVLQAIAPAVEPAVSAWRRPEGADGNAALAEWRAAR